jgi:hypothetical protein
MDELVAATPSVSAELVVTKRAFSRATDGSGANTFVASLTDDQRVVLASMLHAERTSAIHDVLARLTWWMDCKDVGLTYEGKPMPVQLSGMGLHGDYIGRLDDWQWPEE